MDTSIMGSAIVPDTAIVLAGGEGIRIAAHLHRPKPLVEVAGVSLLENVCCGLISRGINRIILCLGHHAPAVMRHFGFLSETDIFECVVTTPTSVRRGTIEISVTPPEYGTGGRLQSARALVGASSFYVTYCDILTDLEPCQLANVRAERRTRASVLAVNPPQLFGRLEIEEGRVVSFLEKVPDQETWINGGVFALKDDCLDLVSGPGSMWEEQPVRRLVAEGNLAVMRHRGYWRTIDTLKDLDAARCDFSKGRAGWITWSDFAIRRLPAPAGVERLPLGA